MNNPLGATPRSTLIKFIILSMCVGAFLAWSGQTPRTLLYNLQYGFEALFGVGFDAFKNLFQYFLYGAVIVAPIWARNNKKILPSTLKFSYLSTPLPILSEHPLPQGER
jgi:Family of unknown function (DUF6460)